MRDVCKRILPLLVMLAAPFSGEASQVYQTTPFNFSAPGWSYTGGTFTVDSFTTIDSSNVDTVITDWSITFSSPTASHTLTPSNSTLSYDDAAGGPNLEATPEALIFPSTPLATSIDWFAVQSNNFGRQWVAFSSQTPNPDRIAMEVGDFDHDPIDFGAGSIETVGPGIGSTIAVREPNPFRSTVFAGACLVAIGRRRRRQTTFRMRSA